jgi:hypothetical protein
VSHPGLGLLRGLRPAPRPPVGNRPAPGADRLPAPGATGDGSHVHHMTARPGRCPALSRQHRRDYAADLHRGLRTGHRNRRRRRPLEDTGVRALHTGPDPPGSSRHNGYGTSATGSLALHLLVSLAGPDPSGSTEPSRRCRGCFPPSPVSPGSGCPQLLPGRCDGLATEVFHLHTVI